MKTTKLPLLCTAFFGLLLAFSQNASAITKLTYTNGNDPYVLGFVQYGILSGDGDRLIYVNHLVGMALGSSNKDNGQSYYRSTNDFVSLPNAVLAGLVSGTSTTIDLGAVGTYTYLFAKYNGPNYGSVVWYVGNLSGEVVISASLGGYGLSGWTLFRSDGPGVPDGGATVMLLGTALGALGMARRFIRR